MDNIDLEYLKSGKWKFEKPRLQRMYMDFLTKEGFKPELEDQGDIAFKYQDMWYCIEIYDEDLEFGRICLMVETEFGEDIIYAHIAASKTSGSMKLVKAYIRDGDEKIDGKEFAVFTVGFLLIDPGHFKKHFQRMVDEIQEAYNEFNEIMKQLLIEEDGEE